MKTWRYGDEDRMLKWWQLIIITVAMHSSQLHSSMRLISGTFRANSITMVARSHKYWTTSSAMHSCHRQVDNAGWMSPWLAIIWWRLSPSSTLPGIAQTTVGDLQSIDVTSRWREDWQSATVVNSTLVVDPTIRLPGFDLHRCQWSLLNRFRTG